MSGGRIERQWRSYRSAVVPADAPAVQVIECRRAFYAGAQALRGEFLKTREDPDGEAGALVEIELELDAFGQSVKAGAA